jgi:hypothetical protein
MIYRRDLIDHFQWLEGSEYLDEVLDEAVAAIVLTAYGHGRDWIQNGAWMSASGLSAARDIHHPLAGSMSQTAHGSPRSAAGRPRGFCWALL